MSWTSSHLEWLTDTKQVVVTTDGMQVPIFEFSKPDNEQVLIDWANHFRNHYCNDDEIDLMRTGTGLSRSEYLTQVKFPTKTGAPGPSIRAGDFAEILVSDYFQYMLNYWVPRTRYDRKTIQNESEKGSDLLAFKFVSNGESPDDILAICEVKAQLSQNQLKNKLQEAVDHSIKDSIRKAESLNALKQRLNDKGCFTDAIKIQRFQNPVDNPYKEVSGAAALFTGEIIDTNTLAATNTSQHPNRQNLILIIIKGDQFMNLVHELYERAAYEA